MIGEEEGVEINVDIDGWPEELAGVRIGDKTFMFDRENKTVQFIADPIWSLEHLARKAGNDEQQLKLWQE